MNENDIRNMLSDIINNGAEYEGRPTAKSESTFPAKYYGWKLYKLGEEVHKDWDYRKIEKWCIVRCNTEKPFMIVSQEHFTRHFLPEDLIFQGTKEEIERQLIESQPSH